VLPLELKKDPTASRYFSNKMGKWFRKHPELKIGDKLLIKKYSQITILSPELSRVKLNID
jgi:hypothetical protein